MGSIGGQYIDVPNLTATSTGYSTVFDTVGLACLSFQVVVHSASGTNPTIQFDLEASDDGVNFGHLHSTKRMTGADSERLSGVRVSARYIRYKWTIGGTSPSFTFSIYNTLKDYLPIRSVTMFRYNDVNLASVGAVSTVFNAVSNDAVSVHIVRGVDATTTAICVIESSNDSQNWNVETGNIDISSGFNTMLNFSGYAARFFRLRVVTPSLLPTYVNLFWASNGGT
jgi:hypothetical protein